MPAKQPHTQQISYQMDGKGHGLLVRCLTDLTDFVRGKLKAAMRVQGPRHLLLLVPVPGKDERVLVKTVTPVKEPLKAERIPIRMFTNEELLHNPKIQDC